MHLGTTVEKELRCNKSLNPFEGFNSHVGEGNLGGMVYLGFQELFVRDGSEGF